VSGVFRLTLAAPSAEWIPGFKAINITCVRKPDITFSLSAVEIPLTHIPGLSDAITDAVQRGVASAIVWPWSVTVSMWV
jgi:Ca2+-dependent lipid-binding protein